MYSFSSENASCQGWCYIIIQILQSILWRKTNASVKFQFCERERTKAIARHTITNARPQAAKPLCILLLTLSCYRNNFWNRQGFTSLIDWLEGIQEYPRDWNLHPTVFARNLPTWLECLPYSSCSRNNPGGRSTTGMKFSSHTIHPKQHPARAVLVTIPYSLAHKVQYVSSLYMTYK